MIISDTEQIVINHLAYIKNHPNCNTNPSCLDSVMIETLHKNGYLKGTCITPHDSETPKYVELHIASSGRKYLNKFKDRNFFVKHWQFFLIIFFAFFGICVQLFIYFDSKKETTNKEINIENNNIKQRQKN